MSSERVRKLVILGAGGHGHAVAEALLGSNQSEAGPLPIAFLDDNESLQGSTIMGIPVLGPVSKLDDLDVDGAAIAIGDNLHRQSAFEAARSIKLPIVSVVHPRAYVALDAKVGDGSVICAGAVVGAGAIVGDDVIINTSAVVDHNSSVGPHSHIASGAILGGDVRVGDCVLVGLSASVRPGVSIAGGVTIGVGAAVVADIAERGVYVGVPARLARLTDV